MPKILCHITKWELLADEPAILDAVKHYIEFNVGHPVQTSLSRPKEIPFSISDKEIINAH